MKEAASAALFRGPNRSYFLAVRISGLRLELRQQLVECRQVEDRFVVDHIVPFTDHEVANSGACAWVRRRSGIEVHEIGRAW